MAESSTNGPTIFVCRHGQTDWNVEQRLQGQADTDINALGRAQADANGRTLKRLIPDPGGYDFVASPMRRTRETMERIRAAMGLDPSAYRVDPRLMELHFGDWQGFTYAELEAKAPGSTASRLHDKWNFRPPGATSESYAMLGERVGAWLKDVRRPTLAVTHGGVIRALFRLAGAGEEEAARLDVPQDRILRLTGGRPVWL